MDLKKVREEAQKEVVEEKEKEAKRKIKGKLEELDRSRKIVKNLERELEDLFDELSAE